jgi:hypothetical protein
MPARADGALIGGKVRLRQRLHVLSIPLILACALIWRLAAAGSRQ